MTVMDKIGVESVQDEKWGTYVRRMWEVKIKSKRKKINRYVRKNLQKKGMNPSE